MREAIAKREADFARGIQKYAENAKRAEAMDKALAPYQQFLAVNGSSPSESIKSVLQTASLLQMGSPAQKAQATVQLIKNFGVDVSAVDQLLVGENPEQLQQQDRVHQAVQQAVAPYQQMMQQWQQSQQAQQAQLQNQVGQEINQFASDPKNEFYMDVRNDMADLMDLAAQRGQEMSLEEAYRRACAMNPQVAQVMESRKAAQQLESKRRAATSVAGSPGGTPSANAPTSIRAALAAAWDDAGRM
jgi:hypothetical protein